MGLKRKAEEGGGAAGEVAGVGDLAKAARVEPPPAEAGRRVMQGQGDAKHTIDSDDEEDDRKQHEQFEGMKDEDMEGQEDDTVTLDGDIKITPFNLKEEQQEGTFSKDGDFVWNKKDEVKDAWLDDVDRQKVRGRTEAEVARAEAAAEAEDEAQAAYSEQASYRSLAEFLKPGETVARALRRLGPAKAVSQAQRWKKKKAGVEEDPREKENKEKMLQLTGVADEILTRSGNMEIYEMTFEAIQYKLKAEDEATAAKTKTAVPEGIDDDDALDMFADNLDTEKVQQEKKEFAAKLAANKAEVAAPTLEEVAWEWKWKETKDEEMHGPHSSQKMLDWEESGFFAAGILVRKAGTEEFRDSKRIDFELYV